MASRASTANKQDSSFMYTTMYSGPRVVCHSMHFTVTTTIHNHFHFPPRSHVQIDSKVFIRRLCHVFPNHMRIDILFSILVVSILGFTLNATRIQSAMCSVQGGKNMAYTTASTSTSSAVACARGAAGACTRSHCHWYLGW